MVLGAGGMLGHTLYRELVQSFPDTWAVTRKPYEYYEKYGIFDSERFLSGLEARSAESINDILSQVEPDVILNCIGMTTRKMSGVHASDIILINSAFPHLLAEWCLSHNRSLIHFSTDCVFDGKSGPYNSADSRDAQDLYGLSKSLGEVKGDNIITIRSSIVGLELEGKTELLEWARSQKGNTVKGFSNVMYSGVTTLTMADVIAQLLSSNVTYSGIEQLASEPISKADLVHLASDVFNLNITVQQVETPVSNKVLIASPFFERIGVRVASWSDQLKRVASEAHRY